MMKPVRTIAFHTLGCKVNQYDTQAMEELLNAAGYQSVPFPSDADVYLLNTCTVTGSGDKKSLQLARRIRREHPESKLILCGCMAQLQGAQLMDTGADLIIGTQHRGEIVSLLNQVISEGRPLCAVEPLPEKMIFEPLTISRQSEHTRAVLKIQEGCRNRCSYCIIPTVRGPIRSRCPEDIRAEAERLAEAGFREIVLTGIHLSSWGQDFGDPLTLIDAIRLLQDQDGILRIRLGSLEPTIATPEFASALRGMSKICPQFHLALQSGSDSVLRRMRRRYNTEMYLEAAANLRAVFPHAALTTDILTGFPGETVEEFEETVEIIRKVGFSRIHVFPYSPRPGTPASEMPGQLTDTVKQDRCRRLIRLGQTIARQWLETWVGRESELLPEEMVDGCWEGYTPEYIRIRLRTEDACISGHPCRIRITDIRNGYADAEIIQ